MATILDSGLFEFLVPVFIFIFIFVLFFALLEKFSFFGKKSGVHALISFCLAVLFIVVPEARDLINFITPWFVVLVVFGMLIIIGLLFMGFKEEDLIEAVTEGGAVSSIIIVIVVILFLVALTKVFGASILQPGGEGFTGAIRNVLFNSKVLGIAFVLLVTMEVVRRFADN